MTHHFTPRAATAAIAETTAAIVVTIDHRPAATALSELSFAADADVSAASATDFIDANANWLANPSGGGHRGTDVPP
ncbi:MAG: hypothetical protein KDA89_15260, partial [Planctomycetaceae bacterium]|nr:hypothetical protein [Planctomycetaceae bacterium]